MNTMIRHIALFLVIGSAACSAQNMGAGNHADLPDAKLTSPQTAGAPLPDALQPPPKGWCSVGTGVYEEPVYGHPARVFACKAGRWVEDVEQEKIDAEAEAKEADAEVARHKRWLELWNRLRTVGISDVELEEVLTIGAAIVPEKDGGIPQNTWIVGGPGYLEQQTQKATAEKVLLDALLLQFKIRKIATDHAGQIVPAATNEVGVTEHRNGNRSTQEGEVTNERRNVRISMRREPPRL